MAVPTPAGLRGETTNLVADVMPIDEEQRSREEDQTSPVLRRIKSADKLTLDLRLSLFAGALYSTRTTTLVKPYPPVYFNSEVREINGQLLTNVFETVPSLSKLSNQTNPEVLDLVDWILSTGSLQIEHLSQVCQLEPEAQSILRSNNCDTPNAAGSRSLPVTAIAPQYIFAVTEPPSRRLKRQTFTRLKEEHGSFYAFHGSALENWHSILHHGLAASLNRRSLFGVGTYLSTHLSMATVYSPFSVNAYGPRKSLFGSKLSVIALCEVINHPDVQRKSELKRTGDQSSPGHIPASYYIVPNNDLIRVAYLLVYGSSASASVSEETQSAPRRGHGAWRRSVDDCDYGNLFFVSFILLSILVGYLATRSIPA